MLKLAPEIKGRIIFYLIASFPLWLFAAAITARFGPLLFWTVTYFSIAMWEPLWSLSYNLMMAQLNSERMLAAVAELRDVISITAVQLLRERTNWMIHAYVFTQLGIATVVTSFAVWIGKGWLMSREDGMPGGWLARRLI